MRFVRIDRAPRPHLVLEDGDTALDLTSAPDGPATLETLLATLEPPVGEAALAEAVDRVRPAADPVDLADETLVAPVEPPEVWAAGVTYEISEEARTEESGMPDVYVDVYESERPELFFKATPSRTVGPGDDVGVREDSTWDTPEPELGIVLYRGAIVGYTIGNDVSSRSIEGANPLYLPQAKIYARSCALGPCVVPAAEIDPHDLQMEMQISRDGSVVYEGDTSTGQLVRTPAELTSYLTRHNVVPDLTVLLTGTALVPEDPFTLTAGDAVEITIEDIGTLSNGVVDV